MQDQVEQVQDCRRKDAPVYRILRTGVSIYRCRFYEKNAWL
jgi:hypothetical protein